MLCKMKLFLKRLFKNWTEVTEVIDPSLKKKEPLKLGVFDIDLGCFIGETSTAMAVPNQWSR